MNHTLDDKQNKFYPVPHPEVGLNSQKLFLLSIWLKELGPIFVLAISMTQELGLIFVHFKTLLYM